MRRLPPSKLAAFALLLVLASCAGTHAQITRALDQAFAATHAASDGFVSWDESRQAAIVGAAMTEESGEVALRDYRAKREAVVGAFAVAFSAIGAAQAALAAGSDPDLAGVVRAAQEVHRLLVAFRGTL